MATNYRISGKSLVILYYKCSKCGEGVASPQVLELSQSYSGGTPIGRAARERQRQQNERQFNDYKRVETYKFADDVNNRRFRNRFTNITRCEKCGNIEPWFYIKNPPEMLFMGLAIPVLVVLLFMLLADGGSVWISWAGLALLALLGIWALIRERKVRRYEEALKSLPEESFPKAVPAMES